MQQNTSSFNLIDIMEVLKRRKSFIGWFVFTACIVTAFLLFFVMPRYYKSTAVIVSANPALADKARLFNENVEGLYSDFGSEEDLDRLLGIAKLDTAYKLLVDKFDLVQYYNISKNNVALNRQKAIEELKDAIELIKTEVYQLKISALTKDKNLSAALANEMVQIIQRMLQNQWKQNYKTSLDRLTISSAELEQQYRLMADTISNGNAQLLQVKSQSILQQIQLNEKLANQFKIALSNESQALIVLEKAYPSAKADKPKKLVVMLAALLSSLAFAIIMVLILQRRQ